MNIFEKTSKFDYVRKLIDLIQDFDPETGEMIIPEGLIEDLIISESEKNAAILEIAVMHIEDLTESNAIGEVIKNLQTRKKSCESKAETKKRLIDKLIDEDESLKDSRVKISHRKSQVVIVNCDPDTLNKQYQIITITTNKTEIKADLLAGKKIKGCNLKNKIGVIIK